MDQLDGKLYFVRQNSGWTSEPAIYQDNVHQQSSCAKLANQSEQSEQALVDAFAVEDQIRLVKKKELDQKC